MNNIVQRFTTTLFRSSSLSNQTRSFNANRAAVTKVKRELFTRLYPVTIVQPDGSTIRTKAPTPRILIRLPLDFDKLSEEEKRKVRLMRQPKAKVEKQKDFKVAFDPLKYAKK